MVSKDGSIVRNPAFEKAIVKFLNEKENELTEEEADELNDFQVESDDQVLEILYALKSRKKPKISVSKYIKLDFILATSCEVERLFFVAKNVNREIGKGFKFEAIKFS
jgi:hypothetical protein